MMKSKILLLFVVSLISGMFFKLSFGEESPGVNLALSSQGSTATCSAYDSETSPSTGASYSASCNQAIDGITTHPGINMMNNTFWGVSNKKLPAWLEITLKNSATLSKIIVKQASVKLTYHIDVSEDDKTWKEIVPSSVWEGPSPTVHTFAPVSAKTIRLTVTDVHYPKGYEDEDLWAVAIWEVEVYEK